MTNDEFEVGGSATRDDLVQRVVLMEAMIAEARQTTGVWGWVIVLWGVASYAAFAWYTLGGHSPWAWPVTMIATFALTRVIHRRRRAGQPRTLGARAIGSIWIAMVLSMFVLFLGFHFSRSVVAVNIQAAIVATMLGTSNAACGLLFRWKQQFACALIWWAAAVVSCFDTATGSTVAFLIAIFFCWIVFGIYIIVDEARRSRGRSAAHA